MFEVWRWPFATARHRAATARAHNTLYLMGIHDTLWPEEVIGAAVTYSDPVFV
jgi:hypothetical protein